MEQESLSWNARCPGQSFMSWELHAFAVSTSGGCESECSPFPTPGSGASMRLGLPTAMELSIGLTLDPCGSVKQKDHVGNREHTKTTYAITCSHIDAYIDCYTTEPQE